MSNNRKYNIHTLIIVCVMLTLCTPQFLSDITYEIVSKIIYGDLNFVYIDGHNRLLCYKFDHKNYDGKLMAYLIKNNLITYKIKKNIKIYKYNQYQYLNNKKIRDYSLFTSSISHLLNEILKIQKRALKICIVVSVRNKLKDKTIKGNFIKFAYYTINPENDIIDICVKHRKSVINVQNEKYVINNTTLHDFISSFYGVDFVFDSWRDLSYISTIDDKLLIRQPTIKITKENIHDLKHNKKRKFVVCDYSDNLNYDDNSYVISDIQNI